MLNELFGSRVIQHSIATLIKRLLQIQLETTQAQQTLDL